MTEPAQACKQAIRARAATMHIKKAAPALIRHFSLEPHALALEGKKLKRCPAISFNTTMLFILVASLISALIVDDCSDVDNIVKFPVHDECRLLSEPGIIRMLTNPGQTLVNETVTLSITYNDGCAPAFNVTAPSTVVADTASTTGLEAENIRTFLRCAAPNAIYVTFNSQVSSTSATGLCSGNPYGVALEYTLMNRGVNRMGLEIQWCPLAVQEIVYCMPSFTDLLHPPMDKALAFAAVNKTVSSGARRFSYPSIAINSCANNNGITVKVLENAITPGALYIPVPQLGVEAFGASIQDGEYICSEKVCTSKLIQLGSFLGFYELLATIVTLIVRWSPCLYKKQKPEEEGRAVGSPRRDTDPAVRTATSSAVSQVHAASPLPPKGIYSKEEFVTVPIDDNRRDAEKASPMV